MTLPGLVAANNLKDIGDRERAWDNLGANISASMPIAPFSLDLNFAANRSLVDNVSGNNLITFSRSSTGTFVGSNGLIQTAASGTPRFDHNSATGESLGLLVEEARTNLIPDSSVFTNAGFWLGNQGITISSNQALAPDGITFNGTLIQQDTSTSLHQLSKGTFGQQLTTTANDYTMSVFVKRFNANRITLCESHHYGLEGYTKAGMVWDFSTESIARTFQWPDSTQSRIVRTSVAKYLNGWYRISLTVKPGSDPNNQHVFPALVIGDSGSPTGGGRSAFAGNGSDGVYIWGFQVESGSYLSSYIPTSGTTVTRAAEVAQITGSNFSSWYNQSAGTIFVDCSSVESYDYSQAPFVGLNGSGGLGDNVQEWWMYYRESANTVEISAHTTLNASVISGGGFFSGDRRSGFKAAMAMSERKWAASAGGSILSGNNAQLSMPSANQLIVGGVRQSSRFRRVVYYPARLDNLAIQYITSASGSPSSTTYPYTFTVKGRDILALNGVSNSSPRDFYFTRDLLSTAQPRISIATRNTASGTILRDAAMPKLAPTTSGNYFFSSGLTLSGVSTRINGTPALSIATTPFSGSTATTRLLLGELRPQVNWRFTQAMSSGAIASPEYAIPFETNDFVFFMKAGQN